MTAIRSLASLGMASTLLFTVPAMATTTAPVAHPVAAKPAAAVKTVAAPHVAKPMATAHATPAAKPAAIAHAAPAAPAKPSLFSRMTGGSASTARPAPTRVAAAHNNGRLVTTKTTTGKTVTYNCSLAGNKAKTACKG